MIHLYTGKTVYTFDTFEEFDSIRDTIDEESSIVLIGTNEKDFAKYYDYEQ